MMTDAEIESIKHRILSEDYDIDNALTDIAKAEYGRDVRRAIYAEGYIMKIGGREETETVDTVAREKADEAYSKAVSAQSSAYSVSVDLSNKVLMHTTAEWAARTSYIPPQSTVLVWTDYQQDPSTGNYIPGVKVADGKAYAVDLPFIASWGSIITQEQINKWNAKVSVMIDELDPENLLFIEG